MSPPRRLVVLHLSPWSERAKWALDHHQLEHQLTYHAPFLGERKLRKLVGPSKKRATVPVLVAGGETITESWDIAMYADREGRGAKLIPAEHAAAIAKWNTYADETMHIGRALVCASTLASTQAIDETLPPEIPRLVRPLLRPTARYGMRWFGKKYGLDLGDVASHEAKLRAALLELRAAVTAGGGRYLVGGSFSYADIVTSVCLQGIRPVEDRYLRIGPGTREAWTRPELARDFSDLLAWRDRLYADHRKKS